MLYPNISILIWSIWDYLDAEKSIFLAQLYDFVSHSNMQSYPMLSQYFAFERSL
ncbi:hypothetical protein JCM9152_1727 [Halalkalibacter hemicellulosilyticusJCM 9152]|uniref:Uncharacterized protein n=1 Tax=Halalkalibacter hemicellulosilyticusJCM 9152 TaxID=1236971 RepID=W4QF92_9BACI|nr:hypothetical protein JCM9152_1727 [Halalkalibacter hemicellulosilyticusJCM 9152]